MTAGDILTVVGPVSSALLLLLTPYLTYKLKALELKTAANGRKTDDIAVKLDATDKKVDKVHELTNSSLTSALEQNKALLHTNQEQKEVITRLTPPPDSVVALSARVAELTAKLAQVMPPLPPGAG